MQYTKLGGTGVTVSRQCLGTMMLGDWGNTDAADGQRLVNRALEAGINFIDTADIYSLGGSEEVLGQALRGHRDRVVLATKCFNPMSEDPNDRGGSRRWIMRAAEASLRRLQTDRIDLFQVHRRDWDTDIEETLGALTDLVRQGKVLSIGSSTFPADSIVEAQWASQRRGFERFACEQPQYSIFARSIEAAVLPTCRRYGMAVISWSPLEAGWLAGKYRLGETPPKGSRFDPDNPSPLAQHRRRFDDDPATPIRHGIVERLRAVADEAGLSLTHLAYGFVLSHPAITSVIVGPRTPEQLEDALAATDVCLDADTLDAIDEIVPPGADVAGVIHGTGDPSLQPGNRRHPRTLPGPRNPGRSGTRASGVV